MARDYYATLQVKQDASAKVIRARFLELARTSHPDLFAGNEKAEAERQFQAITEAFNILSNPERRRQHDGELARPEAASQEADPGQVLRVFMQRGLKAYRERDYRDAALNFDRATNSDPNNAPAWYNLAMAYSHEERWYGRAASAIAKACELDTMNANYFKVAGRLHAKAGMKVRAERYLREALKWSGPDEEIEAELASLGRG